MGSSRAVRRLVCVVSAAVILGAGATVAERGAGASTQKASVGRFTPAVGRSPQVRAAGEPSSSGGRFYCETTTPAQCLSPQMMRAAYGVDKLTLNGAGRTIVIVDAYTSPTIRADLERFDKIFRLPDPPFKQVAPDGLPPYDPDSNQGGWAGEISLDVEWAHAIAPAAKIVLVSARSDKDPDIRSALRYAVDHDLGEVISQSFYETETCVSAGERARLHQIYAKASAQGTTLFASSGDVGAAAFACQGDGYLRDVALPAADPLVTGVGGTTLRVRGGTGAYLGESAWNGGGGGVSRLYPRPDFQSGLGFAGRAVPDISYEANGATGPLVVWSSSSYDFGPVFEFGGTSVGSPQWAGLVALVDQAAGSRVGVLNPALYALAATPASRVGLHDVKTGDNTYPYAPRITGYQAHVGYDLATGLGTPRADELVPALAGYSSSVR